LSNPDRAGVKEGEMHDNGFPRPGRVKDEPDESSQVPDRAMVSMTLSRARATPKDRFEITRLLPLEHGNYQYRIRSVIDGH